MSIVEFNLLGSLEVIVDGRRADLGGRKQQMVLAVLLLNRNRVVSTDRLIDVLWGERPTQAAAQTLRSYLYHLRRALEPTRAPDQRPDILVTRTPGYFLRVEPGELDSDRFEALAGEGHAALARGDPAAASSRLRAGLDLWRGSALTDFADEEFAGAAIARLHEQRLAAIEALFDSRLMLGEHRELIGELEEFTQQHPDREAGRAQLMLALHRSGRQADALQRYKDAWRYFQEEHGIEPEQLKTLEAGILRDDPELSWTPPGDEPGPASGPPPTATGKPGGQHPDPSGRERQPIMALHQLPPDTDVLAGREAQLDELGEILGSHEGARATTVVLITGQAGVGKTALAVRAAHMVRDTFPDGQLYVQLEGTQGRPPDPYTILGQLLWALGIPGAQIPGTLEERMWLYRDRLAGRRALVLLDNAASEAQVRPLLPGSASCAVLVTTRSSLGGLDATRFLELHVLAPDDAMQLLGRLIGPARAQAEPDAARQIVQLCGGLPLALCIVGAKLRGRDGQRLRSLAERLSREQGRLGELAAGDRAVRASFAPSFESLQAEDKRAFQLLGLLRSPDFAAWVIAPLLEEACTVAEQRAERLADAHLLEFAREDETGRVRYRFHDLLRLFAQELLGQHEEAAQRAAVVRLLGTYLGLTRQADAQLDFGGLGGVDDRATWPLDDPDLAETVNRNPLEWFAAEHASLVRAVEQAFEAELHELTPTLANTIAAFCEVRGHLDDWLHTHELALRAARADGNRRWEAYTLCGLGVAYRERGELQAAVRYFEECLPIAWELGDGRLVFFAMLSLGVLHRLQSRWEQAMTTLDQCLDMVEGRDEPYWHAYTLREIGVLHRYRGNWEEAIDRFQQASKLLEHVHSRRWLAATFREIGIVHREQGRLEDALELFWRSMELFREVGDRRREAATLRGIGIVRLRQRRLEDARDHLERSLRIFRERHDRHGAACTLIHLGEVYSAYGDHRQAADLINEGLATFKQRGDHRWEGKALVSLGSVSAAAGRRTTAEAHWRAAARLLGELEAPEAKRVQTLLEGGSIRFNDFSTPG
jgi:DNA-binding SARP family transcriptional activator/predicted negative regulator of RcsB-dependent stress response